MRRVALHFPPALELVEIVDFVPSLAARSNSSVFSRGQGVVFELRATSRSTTWSMDVDAGRYEQVIGHLRANLPSMGVGERIEERVGERLAGVHTVIELRLSDRRRPLRSDIAAELTTGLLTTFQGLHHGEVIRIQWHLGPAVARPLIKASPSRKQQRSLLERLNDRPRIDSEQAQAAKRKQQEPVFAALGRIAVSGASKQRGRVIVKNTLAQLR